MSTDTPTPERVTLTDEGHPPGLQHSPHRWFRGDTVERILAAREQALREEIEKLRLELGEWVARYESLREEIAGEIEAEAHPFRALADPDGHRATLHAARIARGGAR